MKAADLIEETFLAYNGGRLREAARLLTDKMLPRKRVRWDESNGGIDTGRIGEVLPDSMDEGRFR